MLTVLFWFLGIVNGILWLLNFLVAMSSDPSARGMVQMFLIPFTVLVGLVSLVIVGFAT